MKKFSYKPSKVGKIGFILISAALFLAVIEVASPDAQAQLTATEKPQIKSDTKVDSINRAVKAMTSRVKESAPELQNRQARYAGIDPNRRDATTDNNDSEQVKSQARKMGEEVARLAKNAAEQTKEVADTDNDACNRCDRDKRDADKTETKSTKETKTVITRTIEKPVTTKHQTTSNYKYDYDTVEKNVYHDNDSEYRQPVARTTTKAVIDHDYPAATIVNHDYEPERVVHQPATRVVVYQEPEREVRQYRTVVEDNHDDRPTYVAAERDVVVAPKELPSTGPGAPVVISLGGIVTALLARKFFSA